MSKKQQREKEHRRPSLQVSPAKYVYFFGSGKADGNRTMKDLLGGKGSGLAEMTNAGLPVPPGFTISTEVCNIYYREKAKIPAAIDREIDEQVRKLEKAAGATLGSTENPLLVSVRSGAKFSMPGMMDTILNLGLNDAAVEGLKRRTGNGRFAFDSYRRFIQMFGNVVLEIPKDVFEHEFEAVKKASRREAGHRSRRAGAARRRLPLQGRHPEEDGEVVSAGSARAAQDVAGCGLPLLDESARHRVPAHLRHPRSHRHRRQRADDGVRQHRRSLGDRRRLHAQSGDGREGVLRRVPHQRPGRGRRLRRPHAAADSRARAGAAQGLQAAARDHDAAGEALQGRSGLRVHDSGRAAVHAADPQRQAHRVCRRRDRDRSRQREADYAERGGAARRSRIAQSAAGARLRSGRVEEDPDRDQRAAGVARRGERAGGVFGRRRRRVGQSGQAGDSRPPRDRAGRHPRDVRRAGHSHGHRRDDLARGGRRPPDGQAVGRRRGRARDPRGGRSSFESRARRSRKATTSRSTACRARSSWRASRPSRARSCRSSTGRSIRRSRTSIGGSISC